MKILSFILGLLILVLNFAPCVDTDIKSTIETEISQSHEHEHSASGLCSAFCYCQCCRSFVTNIIPLEFNLYMNEVSDNIFFYFDNISKEITFPILQPPRV